jgi:7,8-dihydroneopterin aldolase/epimerase/oxygenase
VDKIVIKDLEVDAHVGVTETERAQTQPLLITVELERELAEAGGTDSEAATTRYDVVVDMIRTIVEGRPRKLVEAIAQEIADTVLHRQLALAVTVEVKKFSIPRSRYVSVQIHRAP